MERYESYKPIDLYWLNEVPYHWEVTRLKRTIDGVINGVWGNDPTGDNDIVCVRVADFNRQTLSVSIKNSTLRDIPFKDRSGRLLKRGDLLLEKSGGGDNQLVGQVVIFNHEFAAVTSNFVAKITAAPGYNSRYLLYLHSCLYFNEINFRSIKQTTGIQNLDSAAYLDELVPIAPLEEQDRIVAFLDQKTAEIDAAIAKKEKLIELLLDQKKNLIHRIVSQGISAASSINHAESPCLTSVPPDWEVCRLKNVASFITSGPRGWSDRISEIGAFFVQSGNLNDSLGLELDGAHRVIVPYGAEAKRTKLRNNDLVICITGANTGRVAVANIGEQEAYVNQHLSLIRLKKANARFIAYYLSAPGSIYFYLCQYGLKEGLSLFNVSNAPILLPPLSTQLEIVEFLDEMTAKSDHAITSVKQQIQQLQELRRTIIGSTVTGQIKV
jgi:type I restriction enzyme S subunit